MLYFIELNRFSGDGAEMAKVLRAQMNHSVGNVVRWAEWKKGVSGAHSWPDITLINAGGLDWRPLMEIVNQCTAETVVLTGRQDSLLGLPTLPHVRELDDLLEFMPDQAFYMTRSSRRACSFQRRAGHAIDTVPVPLKTAH